MHTQISILMASVRFLHDLFRRWVYFTWEWIPRSYRTCLLSAAWIQSPSWLTFFFYFPVMPRQKLNIQGRIEIPLCVLPMKRILWSHMFYLPVWEVFFGTDSLLKKVKEEKFTWRSFETLSHPSFTKLPLLFTSTTHSTAQKWKKNDLVARLPGSR